MRSSTNILRVGGQRFPQFLDTGSGAVGGCWFCWYQRNNPSPTHRRNIIMLLPHPCLGSPPSPHPLSTNPVGFNFTCHPHIEAPYCVPMKAILLTALLLTGCNYYPEWSNTTEHGVYCSHIGGVGSIKCDGDTVGECGCRHVAGPCPCPYTDEHFLKSGSDAIEYWIQSKPWRVRGIC